MELLKIIIADDDRPTRTVTRRFLEELPYVDVVAEVKDGEELLQQVVALEPNLVLLDINMPNLDGIDAIKECMQILPQLLVIIISGHAEYALEAFDFSAVDYLVKPIERTRLLQALQKAKQIVKMRNRDEWSQFLIKHTTDEKLIIHSDGLIYFINVSDILFIEKVNRKSIVHTANKTYEVAETLGSFLLRLQSHSVFFQTHRAFIVNFSRVTYIKPSGETNLVYFDNYREPAYISKGRINELLRHLKRSEA